MTHGPRHHPPEQKQQRQPHELHPARDLDPRGARRHASDGIAEIRRIRRDSWDWTEGALALDWVEPRLNEPQSSDTVPLDMPSSRPSRRRRVERRAVRAAPPAPRVALLTLLAVVLAVDRALSALCGGATNVVARVSEQRSTSS